MVPEKMNGQLPFEGDTFILGEIIKLKERLGLTRCVETGTQYGATAIALRGVFPEVHTIEADPATYNAGQKNIHGYDIWHAFGTSQEHLPRKVWDNTLYYLDAHGCDVGGCPLKEELAIIAGANLVNIAIVIHDFEVPGKDFGFDTYDYPLTMTEIEPLLKRIFKAPKYHYNTEADGARRGIVYIYEG